MATGYFVSWLEGQVAERKCELIVLAAGLDERERSMLFDDWDAAQALIHYELTLKLGFWQTLPYVVFGLGSTDIDKARASCGQAVELYDQLTATDERHMLTELMLSEQSQVGVELPQLAAGHSLNGLAALGHERTVVHSCSIIEESIEGKHAIVNRGIRHASHVSAPYVSCSCLRAGEIERRVEASPQFLNNFSQHLDQSRQPLMMAATIGILQHPVLQQCLEEGIHKKHGKSFLPFRLLTDVVYRCDVESQFADHSGVDRVVSKRRIYIERQEVGVP